MSEPLTGFVRVKSDDMFNGRIGMIASTPNFFNDYYLVRLNNDNDNELSFYPNELEQLDTIDAQRMLRASHANGEDNVG